MAKYLFIASYTPEGMKGVISKGGSARREAASKAVTDLGGSLESYHFAFGDADAYLIADLPDGISAAALGMAVAATGMVQVKTVVLLTPEEIDRAAQASVSYQPPGT